VTPPPKPPRKGFPLRLPPELLDELRGWAEQEMRSLNAQIEWVLRDALRQRRRRADPRPPQDRRPPRGAAD
jgi:hypothetical protein